MKPLNWTEVISIYYLNEWNKDTFQVMSTHKWVFANVIIKVFIKIRKDSTKNTGVDTWLYFDSELPKWSRVREIPVY